MRTCCSLYIILGVPITIEYDDDFGCSEVDALPTSLRRQEEYVPRLRWVVEAVNGVLSITGLDLTVYLLIPNGFPLQVLLNDSQHVHELTEYQNLPSLSYEALEELIQQHHLTRTLYQHLRVLVGCVAVLRQFVLHLLYEEGVVATLTQLDLKVVQLCCTCS